MAKKKNPELDEYMESHNVDVPPPKTEFRDTRMCNITCPLCKDSVMNTIKFEEHAYGEFGLYQCSNCGAAFDICNMVNKPAEFSLISRLVHGAYFQSLKTILKDYGDFFAMPKECSIHHVEAEKQKTAALKDARMDFCKDCKSKFTPQKSCPAVRDYCTTCRKDIPKDDERWKKDVKAIVPKVKKTTPAKRVKKPVAKTTDNA